MNNDRNVQPEAKVETPSPTESYSQPTPAGSYGQPSPPQVPQPAQPPRFSGRRVGTITMGIALICFGGLLIAALMFPNVQYISILQFSPIILVALGIEIIIQYIVRRNQPLKYDFLSCFVCILLIGASLILAAIPVAAKYFGPARHDKEQEMESLIYDSCYDQLSGFDDISSLNVNLNLRFSSLPENMTIADLNNADSLNISCTLSGDYASAEEFVAAVRPVLKKIMSIDCPVTSMSFHNDNDADLIFDLYLPDRFAMNQSAEKMIRKTDVTSCGPSEEDLDEENFEGDREEKEPTSEEGLEVDGSESMPADEGGDVTEPLAEPQIDGEKPAETI